MPIPVYSASPINAAKPDGVTPQTAKPEDGPETSGAPAATTSTSTSQGYPPAQPGARPSLPMTTGAPQAITNSIRPTPTQNIYGMNPPAPQPGAFPVPAPTARHIPPPPKAGEATNPAAQVTAAPIPPQMSYQPPDSTYTGYGGTSTTPYQGATSYPGPVNLQNNIHSAESFSHPPGYHQNTNAAEFSSNQRAAHNAYVSENSSMLSSHDQGGEQGVWGTAKKWASAAGDSLANAEQEVWKRINKD